MKLFLYLFVAAVSVIIILFIISFFLPDTYNLERSQYIKAPQEQIYNYVSDLKNWSRWSAWNALHDSSAVYKIEGTQSGAGTAMTYSGERLGKGKIVISEENPPDNLKYDLMINDAEFIANGYINIKDTAGGSVVTWGDNGQLSGPVARLMFIVVKGEIANNFQVGLDTLKNIMETGYGDVPEQQDESAN